MDYTTLKTAIDANINTNGNQEITGAVLNSVLNQMVDDIQEQTEGELTELEQEVFGYSKTDTINSDTWWIFFDALAIEKGQKLRFKLNTDNPFSRVIVGTSDNKIFDSRDEFLPDNNTWVDIVSPVSVSQVHLYVTFINGVASPVTLDVKTSLAIATKRLNEIDDEIEAIKNYNEQQDDSINLLNYEVFGYSKTDTINSSTWWIYFKDLPISIGQRLRFKINTNNPFTRVIIGTAENRIFDSQSAYLPANDTWVDVDSSVNVSMVQLYVVFTNGIASPVTLSLQTGLAIATDEIDDLKNSLQNTSENLSELETNDVLQDEKLTELEQEVFGYSKTDTINSDTWWIYFKDLPISIGQRLRFKINTNNPFTRVIIGTAENRIFDSRDEFLPDNNTWVDVDSSVNVSMVQLYVAFADGIASPVTLSLQTGLAIINQEFDKLKAKDLQQDNRLDTIESSNVLYGKKWAVCGDSFTAGVLSTTLGEGRYADKRRVYPYYIGNRANMEILNFFEGGRTLAYPASGDFENSLTAPNQSWYYQNIPEDVDYITIYLGINDSHHNYGSDIDGEDVTGHIPLGSIDDNTTASYYGAWNVVLSWLIENRPFAHIGIIVSNACDWDSYRLAQIEISKKYGIPYIDLNGDERTPAMLRSTNPEIDASVKELRLRTQRVSETNAHPNDSAHLFESTFIENFIRSL